MERNNSKLTIYFDIDDVGNRLIKHLIDIYNQEFKQDYDWKQSRFFYVSDNPEVLVDASYFVNILKQQGTFLNLEPDPGYVNIIHRLIKDERKVRILTHPMWESDYCMNEKIGWIKKHLPFFNIDRVVMAKIKHEMAKPGRVLIDDNPDNLAKWELHGGIGIAFGSALYSKAWHGIHTESFEELYEILNKLEKEIRVA